MKFNIANPLSGSQIKIEVVDDLKLRLLYDKSLASELNGSIFGAGMEDYKFKISGGNDKQGFGMKQGVLTQGRVKLLMSPGDSCFRGFNRRRGERRRKSVRGCIVSPDIACLNLVMLKQGKKFFEGLNDKNIPFRHGPRRATKIRGLFCRAGINDDIVRYGRSCNHTKQKKHSLVSRAPTPIRLQRKSTRRDTLSKKLKKNVDNRCIASNILRFKRRRRVFSESL